MKPDIQNLLTSLPNYGGTMLVNGTEQHFSFLELSRPTGKYIARGIIRLGNLFLERGFFRFIGNSCTPGIVMSEIDPSGGLNQFKPVNKDGQVQCGIIIANVAGNAPVTDGILIPADPFMVLPIRKKWKSFEDYKSDMSSKYRVRTNRVFALSHAVEMKILNEEDLNQWIPACAKLLSKTLQHKTITIGSDLELVLRTFYQSLQNNFQINGYFLDGNLIGFISYIRVDREIYAMHLGYDDAIGKELHLYQRIMYDLIEISIKQGIDRLNLGRTAPEIKSTLGALPEENSFVFFSRNAIGRILLNYYVSKIHQPTEYTLRHPFKPE